MKGILMKPWKTKAIADSSPDRLWQTRRVAKLPYNICVNSSGVYTLTWDNENECHWRRDYKPRYQPNELVYIKESIQRIPSFYDEATSYHTEAVYRLDNAFVAGVNWVWKRDILTAMFLPEALARYFIRITDVRAERLQSITEKDCLKEGILLKAAIVNGNLVSEPTYRDSYAMLWDSINGKGSWDKNEWVWVYSFKKVEVK